MLLGSNDDTFYGLLLICLGLHYAVFKFPLHSLFVGHAMSVGSPVQHTTDADLHDDYV